VRFPKFNVLFRVTGDGQSSETEITYMKAEVLQRAENELIILAGISFTSENFR
jgi:hypothetical protein